MATSTKQTMDKTKGAGARRRPNIRMMQNVMLIWLDKNINKKNEDCYNTVTQLRHGGNTVHTFTDTDRCIDFVTDSYNETVVLIISGALCQNIVPLVHDIDQLHKIFIFCKNKIRYEQWAKQWSKIKDVFTEVTPICKALKQASQQCEQNAISISFVATNGDASSNNLDQLDPMFMYTQIMKEILLTIEFDQEHVNQFIAYCRDTFDGNENQLKYVDELGRKYLDKTPIWWYTCECFLYPMLNRALRTTDVDIIIQMGFFISDLHRDVEKLYKQQLGIHLASKTFTVYRGQGLSSTDFDQMMNTKGGLLSFNNFLSTSKDRAVSFAFAESNQYNPDFVGILFIMTIDPSKSTTPFASINGVSYFQTEDEVLFSMHTVFRIGKIQSMGENSRLFQVDLTLTGEDDKDLQVLTDRIREETYPNSRGWYRLGLVLGKMGRFDKSQQVYEALLDQTTDESEKAPIYGQIASAKDGQGEYEEAIKFYGKTIEIQQQSLPPNHPQMATAHSNIGVVYHRMGDYPKALSCYEKALAIWQQSLPRNHPQMATAHSNIGVVYHRMGDYPKALSCYEKALAISQQSLPRNHPSLALSCNNIGVVYIDMGNYPKALTYYEKTLGIQQQSLPPNHPSLASAYNNIGNVYYKMGDYPKALSCYEKALKIKQQTLPPNHPSLAMSYIAHGLVYNKMKEYPKAIAFYEKALEIQKQSLPQNHPDLAMSYNNISIVYDNMDDYPKELSCYEKALEIRKQSLPPNHPDLASSYNNIGTVYYKMGDYPKALSCYEKALEIRKQSLSPNHLDLASLYDNMGVVYCNMDDESKALSSYEQSLEIRKQSLPSNHPDLAMPYNNIGVVYQNISDYPKALSYYEKALEIQKQSLPPNHPDLAMSYANIGLLYEKKGDYSKARSFLERSVNIAQQSLPSNHPNLQKYRNNIEEIKNKL
jgi:tetratricopeptide (TPR) repeat protein